MADLTHSEPPTIGDNIVNSDGTKKYLVQGVQIIHGKAFIDAKGEHTHTGGPWTEFIAAGWTVEARA